MKRRAWTQLFDVYALASARSATIVEVFRARWAQGFQESADEYLIPRLAEDPTVEFRSCEPLLKYLIATPTQDQAVYWCNLDDNARLRNAMMFFTEDSALIVGISVWANSEEVAEHMVALCDSVAGKFAYVTGEEPPPETAAEFVRLARSTSGPRIVDGKLTI